MLSSVRLWLKVAECGGHFVAGPRTFGRNMDKNVVDESTLNFTVTLHGTTQTRCIGVAKTVDHALRTLNNISCPFFRSFTIVWHQSCPQSTARFIQPIQGENKDVPSLFDYM